MNTYVTASPITLPSHPITPSAQSLSPKLVAQVGETKFGSEQQDELGLAERNELQTWEGSNKSTEIDRCKGKALC
jgi:hypothetical protein